MSDRLLPLIFAGIGVLAVVLSVAGRPTVPSGWIFTTGTVVGFVEVENEGTATQAAVVEYTDTAGMRHRVVSNASFGMGLGDKLGDSIQVAYNSARPSEGRLLGGTASWGWLVSAAIGLLFAVIGFALLAHQLRAARQGAPTGTPVRGVEANVPLVETSRLTGFGYVFPRARTHLWLDFVIAPAMTLMFGAFAALTFSQGSWFVLVGIAAVGAALLLVSEVLFDIRRGLFAPAAEVGPGGIWLRGVGAFAWNELAEVRHERFASSAGEQGLAMYDRLALVPRDPFRIETARASALTARIANGYHGLVTALAGRRPLQLAPIGLMGYEVADFEGLLSRVREYFPVLDVSDEPSTGK